jgi:ABC-type glycerol-3-phosphate transport system substrate-binding protein
MKKKTLPVLISGIVLLFSLSFAKEAKVTTIKFYGSSAEYNQQMVQGFEKSNPSIKVEIVPVDFTKAEQVIKTGIASGNPVDVSFFWGSQMSTFVDNDMALDLTKYLMEDNKKWYNTFVGKLVDAGKFGNKWYAISYQPVIETFFINEDLFKEHNLAIPKTVDDMLKVAAALKEKGLYGFGCWTGYHHQMLPWTYQTYANNGVLKDASAGKLPFAGPNETPGLRQNLELIKEFYDKGYWYPGEGALTATQEQVQAAWYQGKIAMVFDANSDANKFEKEAPFKVWAIPFPLIKEGGKYTVNVITNALFIPANAKKQKEAIEFMKYYTSPEGQAITNASGRPPSTKAMQETVENPLVREILSHTSQPNSEGYSHLQGISSEVDKYLGTMIGSICAGQSIDEALEGLEKLRVKAQKK